MNNNVPKPERKPLLTFLNEVRENKQFVIPVYQRNYIWQSNKQVKKFLDDYELVLKNATDAHFIGILMFLIIQKSITLTEYSIVDGQQRTITIFLFLQALKEIAKENGNIEFANNIENKYLTNPNISDAIEKLKLKPLVSDDEVYRKIVLDQQSTITREEKKSNVYINYEYIKRRLKELYGNYPIEDMLEALDKFYFVIIPLGTGDNAQEIFETINSAGAELSKSDLIRNYILMNIDSNEQERLFNDYWQPVENLFERNGKMENFFRMFLANQTKVLDNMEDIYNVFQKWFINERDESGRSVEDILKIIKKYATYYYNIFISSTNSFESPIKESLEEFKKSTIEPTAPLLMEVYNLYESKNPNGDRLVSADSFAKIIDLLNTYNIRRNLCNLRTGVLTRIIPPMLGDILEDCSGNYNNIYNSCVKFLVDNNRGKASMMPDDAYLKSNLSSINAYALKSYLKVAFEKVESYIEVNGVLKKNPAVLDFSNLSIEHLMPQTITPEWYDVLKIPKEDYEYQLNRIGNLTLATHSDNSRMSNNPFEYKKEILNTSGHINMNKEILSKEGWSISDIDNRTKEIIDKICKVYPYVSYTNEEVKKYDIYYNKNNDDIKAYIYEDESVEIQNDSYFVKNNYSDGTIQELINDGVITSHDDGYKFIEVYTFENLLKVSNILLEECENAWEEWIDSEGLPLNYSLRAKIMNSKNNNN